MYSTHSSRKLLSVSSRKIQRMRLPVRMTALASKVADACDRLRSARHHRVHSNAVPMETRHQESSAFGVNTSADSL